MRPEAWNLGQSARARFSLIQIRQRVSSVDGYDTGIPVNHFPFVVSDHDGIAEGFDDRLEFGFGIEQLCVLFRYFEIENFVMGCQGNLSFCEFCFDFGL